jgi:TonB family protein
VLLTFIVIGLIIPWLPSPEAEKKPLKQIAPRLAKLITQKRQQKPKIAQAKAAKKKSVKKKAKKKVKKKKPAKAKKKARQSGLMASLTDIQDMKNMFDTSSLNSNKPLKNNHSKTTVTERSSVISTRAKRNSGGIDTSKLSRTTGSTALTGRRSSNISSNIGDGVANIPRRTRSGQNARGLEELTIVFDKYKGALEAIYVRALRNDPTLQGKVVFELTISPSGKVTKCRIISSELGAKKLERRLVSRVKSFLFSKKDVATVTVTYPIHFLPS